MQGRQSVELFLRFPHRGILLKDKHLVGFHSPLAEQIHTAHVHPFCQIILPETSGVTACPSGGDFTAPGDGLEHALDIVIALRRLLVFAGAEDPIR